jgi:two-component system OmpR family response regulator
VLVVEDEPAVREFLTVALCDLGYQAIAAPDGARALDLLDAVSPDVILLDLFMPVMSGFEFASVYRQRPGQHAPIVVCSAAQHRAAEVGAQASLAKPFSLHELASCVAGQISVP